jgi:small subunit ribosomal protein S16
MVKIRLKRVGKRKQPSYRVVVADSRSPRDGRIIESIGHYHPRSEPSEIVIDTERAKYWLDRGAQASETVGKLLKIAEGGVVAPAAAPKKVKATVAASVADEAEPVTEEPAATPEAVDQQAAAPEATASEDAAPDEPEG